MSNIILQEKAYAEKILESKVLCRKPTFDLRMLAKYYYTEEKLTPHKIYLKLVNIMEEKYNNFALSKWQDILLDLAKNAKKYPLINIDYVPITENELSKINKIESKPMKRLAFTLLCLAKYKNIINHNNDDWVGYKFKDIFKMANINATKREQGVYIHDLKFSGLIKMNKMVDNLSINVCYIDKEFSKEVLQISDFRNLGYEYLLYSGESFFRCENCGILKRSRSNNDKYCNECKTIVKNEKNKQYYHLGKMDTYESQ